MPHEQISASVRSRGSSQPQASAAASKNTLSRNFIEQCQLKLAEYIGPMAPLIIDEIIDAQHPSTPVQLVDLIIPEIPSLEEAKEFR